MIDLLWNRPDHDARATLLLAHGAGAPMDSSFMERFTHRAAAAGLAVARFEFGYMARRRTGGRKAPPPKAELLVGEYQTAVQAVLAATTGPVLVGGKSMGGRVAALYCGGASLPRRVAGLICLGYPFNPQNKPDAWRLEPLQNAKRPVLVLQGERDPFGSRAEVEAVGLPGQVALCWLEDGNHDFGPRGASPASWDGNLDQAAQETAAFAGRILASDMATGPAV